MVRWILYSLGDSIRRFALPFGFHATILKGQNGRNSYALSLGDTLVNQNANNIDVRGVFPSTFFHRGFRDISDGLSNTIAISERTWSGNFGFRQSGTDSFRSGTASLISIMTNPGTCLATIQNDRYALAFHVKGRFGALYSDGQAERVGFTTILGPNKPSCVNDYNMNADSNGGVLSATSYHPGGVNGLMADGAVRLFSNTIDTGNVSSPPVSVGPSPYGIWGALGTISGGETLPSEGF